MSSAWDVTFSVRPPRAVFLDFPLNHQTGKADEPELQRRILLDALRAFERAPAGPGRRRLRLRSSRAKPSALTLEAQGIAHRSGRRSRAA
jgi:hypothetical protein